jgi:replication initiation protein RepC
MQIISSTPFGQRAVTADQLTAQAMAIGPADVPHFDKWELFRELCVARHAYRLTDRDLTVLNALLSFHKDRALSDNANLIVFPSNRALGERAHGMAESTLRRHVSALVNAGVITRHDSPNGKRYAAKDASGDVIRAFGFNLRALLVKATEISNHASEARAAGERYRRLREECSVALRDASKLTEYGIAESPKEAWRELFARAAECQRAIRRKLAYESLELLSKEIRKLLKDVHRTLGMPDDVKTNKMSGKDGHNERHYQNSNKDSYDLEPTLEEGGGGSHEAEHISQLEPETESDREEGRAPKLPLGLVLKSCPDILDYAQGGISDWYDMVATGHFIRGMMGISPDAWENAQRAMGPENAAVVLACMLQKVEDIHSPGGYLRALTNKSIDGAFSPGPMVMALLNGGEGQAA